ncbi:MAG: PAS domain-containing sensor histidine kinase [Phyllobacteriaceae bacterium]|nr:PAS domain-containing sensor histidine kinase [Phyllobacteriaceae bacterium]
METGAYPFLDIAVNDAVRGRLAAGDALAVLSADLSRIVWANGHGALIFGFDGPEDAIGRDTGLSVTAHRQIAGLRGFPRLPREMPVLVRMGTGIGSRTVAFQASSILLPRGEAAILLAIPAEARGEYGKPQVVAGLSGPENHAALIGPNGEVLECTDGYDRLGIAAQTLAALVKAVAHEDDRLVKRMIDSRRGPLPAGFARLRDDPALHLLLAVEPESDAADKAAPGEDRPTERLPLAGSGPDEGEGLRPEGTGRPGPRSIAEMVGLAFTAARPEDENGGAADRLRDDRPANDDMPDAAAVDEPGIAGTMHGGGGAPGNTAPHDDWYFEQPEQAARPAPDDGTPPSGPEKTDGEDAAPFVAQPGGDAQPVRFVWRTDAEGRFTSISDEFCGVVGPAASDIIGRPFEDVAAQFGIDPDGDIAGLLSRRDTWSGRCVYWPLQGTAMRAPVDLAALPIYSRDRSFEGFRGFGVIRPGDAVDDPAATGMALAAGQEARRTGSGDMAEAGGETEEALHGETQPPLPEPDALPEMEHDPFHGETPALAVDTSLNRRLADKIIRLEERRDRGDGKQLSSAERLAFESIGRKLREATPSVAEPDGSDSAPAEKVSAPPAAGDHAEAKAEAAEELPAAASADTPVEPREPSRPPARRSFAGAFAGAGVSGAMYIAASLDTGPERTGANDDRAGAREMDGVDTGASPDALREAETLLPEDNGVAATGTGEPANADTGETGSFEPAPAETGLDALQEVQAPEKVEPVFPSINAYGLARPVAARPAGDALPAMDTAADQAPDRMHGPDAENVPDAADAQLEPEGDPAPEDGQKDRAAPLARRLAAGDVSPSFLARLPVPVLVSGGGSLAYANAAFLSFSGHASLAELDATGGLDALFGEAGPEGPEIRLADGSTARVRTHMQTIGWNGGKALMLAFLDAGDEDEAERPEGADMPSGEPSGDAPRVNAFLTSETTEKLQATVRQLNTILDTATDGVILIENDGTIRAMNRSAQALFGHDSEAMTGEPFIRLFATESQRAAGDYLSGLAGNGVASVLNDGREVIGREAKGRFIPLYMTIGKLPSDGGFCAVMRDITNWKRAEEELTEARRQAEDASSQKTQFLARVSHEIRTPLNAIIGFSELMLGERFGPIGNQRYKDYLRDINRSGNHVLDLVNDLLDISKIEAGHQELSHEAVPLNDILSEAVAIMQPQANRERVIIRSSLVSGLPDVVADKRSMRQIALNLLSNAVKFTPPGGQVIVSTSYEASGEIVMHVRDTGIGMTASDIEHAMKPFKQLNTMRRTRGDGTGLGLPLTKALVEANRARFAITSTPGEGTIVEVIFPPTRVLAD